MAGQTQLLAILNSRAGVLKSTEQQLLESVVRELEVELTTGEDDNYFERKSLWIEIVAEACRINNGTLCLLMIRKLGLHDLTYALGSQESASSQLMKLVANYFQFEGREYDLEETESIPTRGPSEADGPVGHQSNLTPNMILMKKGFTLEIEEDTDEALKHYEELGLHHQNLVRLTIKQLSSSSEFALQEYCATLHLVRNIWFEYLIAQKNFNKAIDFSNLCDDESFRLKIKRLTSSLDEQDPKIRGLSNFLDAAPSEWMDTKMLNIISSDLATRIDMSTKMLMAELTYKHLERQLTKSALALALCLNEPDLFTEDSLLQTFDCALPLDASQSQVCSHLHAASSIVRLIRRFALTRDHPEGDFINRACMKLGLLDEAMSFSTMPITRSTICIGEALRRSVMVANCTSGDKLCSIDPRLPRNTIIRLLQILRNKSNKELNNSAISLILNAIKIFLMKFKAFGMKPRASRLVDLEGMFDSLTLCLRDMEFSASEELVRATNSLILVIKDKLDVLADNEIIRESFKILVDKVAGQCLVEARYKSAALLYSLIGDNTNAIKSLMRTGEVQTVIDYALLVRDITVDRITINFLKHLKVDVNILEEFLIQTNKI